MFIGLIRDCLHHSMSRSKENEYLIRKNWSNALNSKGFMIYGRVPVMFMQVDHKENGALLI
jgi:hypothetical protein